MRHAGTTWLAIVFLLACVALGACTYRWYFEASKAIAHEIAGFTTWAVGLEGIAGGSAVGKGC